SANAKIRRRRDPDRRVRAAADAARGRRRAERHATASRRLSRRHPRLRRGVAVILGKNPDKIEPLEPTPYPGDGSAAGGTSQTGSATPSATAAASPEFPPQNRASLSLQPPPPFDPTAVPRTGGSDPPECKAARLLRIQHHDREADMMNALCIAKGGDGGV